METAIKEFFDERKAAWLKQKVKISMTEEEKSEIEMECEKKFDLETWLPDAAKRASWLAIASHPCKFSHPDAETTAVIAAAEKKPDGFLRTGNTDARLDVSAKTAAALDVNKFLSLKDRDGIELLAHIENGDSRIKKMLKIATASFEKIQADFLSIKKTKEAQQTDGRIKQVYFPVEGKYHLLSILTPSGLMYELKNRINESRFSDQSKNARDQRKKGDHSETGFDDLTNLTMVGYGGANKQNISVLNNQNGGKVYLLPSMPPLLENKYHRLPKYNFFENSLWQNMFTDLFHGLSKLLRSDYNNLNIRDARDRIIGSIIDRIIEQAWKIKTQEPGWTQREAYSKLLLHHKIWLDNFYEQERETSDAWLDKVMQEMARWILLSYNKTVKDKTEKLGNEELNHILSLVKQNKEAL